MLWFIQQFPRNQSHVLQKNAESFGSMLIMELRITDLTVFSGCCIQFFIIQ